MKIAINGLGRIGRLLLRGIVEGKYNDLAVTIVNGPASTEDHVHFLKYDSIHGVFPGEITYQDDIIFFADRKIKVTHERDINQLSWPDIDIVLECTGKFNKRDKAALHLTRGAKRVVVSAPCENADATIVYGVNEQTLSKEAEVISVGSCTTNCLAPVVKVLNDNLGIENGFMTTIHSYTNDQNIMDASHKDKRRARAAALSMIPTSTGAAKSIGLVLPELSGKLDGAAIRVPTPNVSMIDLCFTTQKDSSVEEINQLFSRAAEEQMKNILGVSDKKLVSIDFTHNPLSAIVDLAETKVINKRFCRVVAWYDNEWGFSMRMLDVTRMLGRMMNA
jgi:glyceraldehyde 3-phosphate dehydrogenase